MISLEGVLKAAFEHPEVAYKLREALASDLVVVNPFQRLIAQFLTSFIDEHNDIPKSGDLDLWIDSLSERQQAGVREAWALIQRQKTNGLFTPDFLAEEVMKELRVIAARNALSRLNAMEEVNVETFQTIAQEVEAIEAVGVQGLANLREVSRWARQEVEEFGIPTGIEKLDRYIGGWKKELVFLMADTGVGKTTGLINFGRAAALYGSKVFHITLELSTANTALRYYRRIAEMDRKGFRQGLVKARAAIEHWFRFAKGEIHVLYQPAYQITPEQLHQLVRLYVQMYDNIDVLIIDYLDLLAPSSTVRNKRTDEQLGFSSHYIRSFCEEFDSTVLSATQATKPPDTKRGRPKIRLHHIAASYEKARAADVVLGLSQTPEEEAVHQARYSILKARESAGHVEIPIYYNMDLMMLGDLDHENTRRVMARLGHLPEQLQEEPVEEEGDTARVS